MRCLKVNQDPENCILIKIKMAEPCFGILVNWIRIDPLNWIIFRFWFTLVNHDWLWFVCKQMIAICDGCKLLKYLLVCAHFLFVLCLKICLGYVYKHLEKATLKIIRNYFTNSKVSVQSFNNSCSLRASIVQKKLKKPEIDTTRQVASGLL